MCGVFELENRMLPVLNHLNYCILKLVNVIFDIGFTKSSSVMTKVIKYCSVISGKKQSI